MSRYRNNKFLSEYIKLDKECAALLSIDGRGVSEYITALSAASRGGDTLKRLTKYRAYRNRLAHEVGALSSLSEITREDIRWISSFIKKIRSHSDPLSRHKRNSEKGSFGYKLRRALVVMLISMVIVLALVLYLSLKE